MKEGSPAYFMQEALREGKKALPDCFPNPPVGCVIVQSGKIVARGHTLSPGKDHAEAMALRNLPSHAKDLSMYVSLEPCSFQGRTPSCAKSIVDYEVKEVYVSMIDPDPRNQGAGIKILEEHGIRVRIGLLEEQAQSDLGPYLIKS